MASVSNSILNINIGILGHVDSGKTLLSRVLSTQASTAAFDKHPQSQERGITLDLGFSSFSVPVPDHLQSAEHRYSSLQFTLVDCPGHASLIRTIIGGAQIVDAVLLVIDCTKGIQTQTAECIVIAEILTSQLFIVLNKVDLLGTPATRAAEIEKVKKRLTKVFENTKFRDAPMIPVSAFEASQSHDAAAASSSSAPADASASSSVPDLSALSLDRGNISGLVSEICQRVQVPKRNASAPLLMAIDHCFPIKGQGTVLTGTVLAGSLSVNQTIEIPDLKVQKKVKSMQMFRRPVETVIQGDRAGVCVTQLDASSMERGLICAPGTVPTFSTAIALVQKVKYFKKECTSRSKLHVTVGHSTVMANVLFFRYPEAEKMTSLNPASSSSSDSFAFGYDKQYYFMEGLCQDVVENKEEAGDASTPSASAPATPADAATAAIVSSSPCFVLLQFEQPVTAPASSICIASRLDADVHAKECRIAFSGRLINILDDASAVAAPSAASSASSSSSPSADLSKLKIYKNKVREAQVDRIVDSSNLIGRNLVKPNGDMTRFIGMKITHPSGAVGTIEGTFGKTGKFKVRFSPSAIDLNSPACPSGPLRIFYRSFLFEGKKTMHQ